MQNPVLYYLDPIAPGPDGVHSPKVAKKAFDVVNKRVQNIFFPEICRSVAYRRNVCRNGRAGDGAVWNAAGPVVVVLRHLKTLAFWCGCWTTLENEPKFQGGLLFSPLLYGRRE